LTESEKRYILETIKILRRYCVEDSVKIKDLTDRFSHERKGRKHSDRTMFKYIELIKEHNEKLYLISRQLSTIFSERHKMKTLEVKE
jgi:hypothetical protein